MSKFTKLPPAESERSQETPAHTGRTACMWVLLSFAMFVEVAMTVPSLIIAVNAAPVCTASTLPIHTWLIVNSVTWMVISCLSIAPLAALIRDRVNHEHKHLFGLNMSVLVFMMLSNFSWGGFGISLAVTCDSPTLIAYVVLDMVLCPAVITWISVQLCCWTGCCD